MSLQEVSDNVWKARYRGNYGVYTVKIKTNGVKTIDFSCSCPSDYYPCKHIPMVEGAIRQRVAEIEKADESEIKLEQLLESVAQKKLCEFIIKQAQSDPQFRNSVLLEFVRGGDTKSAAGSVDYSQILRSALNAFHLDRNDYGSTYDENCIEINVLDQWLDKVQNHVNQNNLSEAVSICKALIKEFAEWYYKLEGIIYELIVPIYQEKPFEILLQILSLDNKYHKELLGFCKTEMLKPKYEGTLMYKRFNTLFMKSAIIANSDEFIELQDKLLHEIKDEDLYEVQEILEWKINFYRDSGQSDKAWEIIKENLSIEDFGKQWIEKLIVEDKLQEAKKLIDKFISEDQDEYNDSWYELKLQIAQKEKDTQEIRQLSFHFIDIYFDDKYYTIYKSTFTEKEWPEKVEELIQHYKKRGKSVESFNESVMDVLRAEKQEEKLIQYMEENLSIRDLLMLWGRLLYRKWKNPMGC
jgi:hypothetical protein